VDANSKLSISGSVADAVGPGVAGYLIQFFSAPYAIFIDAMTYFAAAGMYASIPDHEPAPNPPARDAGLLRRVAEGLSTLWGHRDLRAIMLCGATHNICSTAIRALFILYMSDELGLGPEAVGLVFACGGVGSIVGGSLAPWLQRRFGTRTALVGSQSLTGFARGLIPVAASFPGLALPILCTSSGLLGVARPVFNVIQLSLRGRAVPDHLQGRVTASFGFLMWGFTPLGALVGGYAGATFGMRPTLIVAAIGVVLATGWLASIRDEYRFSPAPGSGNRGESATSPE
ncbi:MAG: MFS transporter, partial [Myxococcota bacterium]